MNDESLALYIEDMSRPVVRAGESIVSFSPGGGSLNSHQIPEWAYQRLLSGTAKVFQATLESDVLKIRIGYKNSQSASTLISRAHELEKQIEIEKITISHHSYDTIKQFPVIADLRYEKDNLDSLLYVLKDMDFELLDTTNTEYIKIIK